jgi:hypothetical protein
MAQSEIASVPSTLGAIIIVGAPISEDYSRPSRSPNSVLLRQDFIGGVVVIGVAPFAFWQSSDLPVGTLGGVGPGMLASRIPGERVERPVRS